MVLIDFASYFCVSFELFSADLSFLFQMDQKSRSNLRGCWNRFAESTLLALQQTFLTKFSLLNGLRVTVLILDRMKEKCSVGALVTAEGQIWIMVLPFVFGDGTLGQHMRTLWTLKEGILCLFTAMVDFLVLVQNICRGGSEFTHLVLIRVKLTAHIFEARVVTCGLTFEGRCDHKHPFLLPLLFKEKNWSVSDQFLFFLKKQSTAFCQPRAIV